MRPGQLVIIEKPEDLPDPAFYHLLGLGLIPRCPVAAQAVEEQGIGE